MRRVLLGLAFGCLLFSAACDDDSTVTNGTDATVGMDTSGVDTSGVDVSVGTDTSEPGDTAVGEDTATADPCDPNPCLNDGACSANSDGAAECACADGWEGDLCDTDTDECAADPNPCGDNSACTNTDGGYDCACSEGFVADDTGACADVDECADTPCGDNEACTNTDGGYECACADGYVASEEGVCGDVDECAADESPCDANATCANTEGGFDCACNEGWVANEDGSCGDLDECADEFSPCGPNATCTNTDGAYECACNEGYEGDGIDCSDVDECAPSTQLTEDFSAVDADGNPVAPEGWTMLSSDMLDPEKEDPVSWHINADGQLQYSNKEGTNYNGSTNGVTGLPALDIVAGHMLHASVAVQVSDQNFANWDQAWIGFLACSTDVDFTGCVAALQAGDVDDAGEPVATLVPLWAKADYNAAIAEAGLEAGAMIDVSLDLAPAAGWTGWLHFGFDSVDDYANDGAGFTVDNVSVTLASDVCGMNEACTNADGGFECACLEGFQADADTGMCSDVDECAGDVCAANEDCTNTDGGFECGCSAGYMANEEGACVDMNECELGMAECDANAACENTEGNYTCVCNDGFSGDGKTCENIDECAEGTDECGENATCMDGAMGTLCQDGSCNKEGDEACLDAVAVFDSWCENFWDGNCAACAAGEQTPFADCTPMGDECTGVDYTVPYTCQCADGYDLNDDGVSCADVDECAWEEAPCSANATCTNNDGGYDCACNEGYAGDGVDCADVDECEDGSNQCDVNASCTNNDGGYDCACIEGLSGDGESCANVDECADGLDMCGDNANCADATPGVQCQGAACAPGACLDAVNALDFFCSEFQWDEFCAACAAGGFGFGNLDCSSVGDTCVSDSLYSCTCDEGYVLNEDGMTCSDVDECAANNGGCAQICENGDGGASCSCEPGYSLGNDGASCNDNNECEVNNGGCAQLCKNEVGSFACYCQPGYELGADGLSCNDVNECGADNGGCAQTCTNNDGGFACSCEAGYVLGDDGKACNDVDECKGENNCDANATCTNTPGSFGCACNEGYSGNGIACEKDAPQGGTDISQNGKMVFGHHGACEGWNDCGSAQGCANMACQQYGHEKATSWNAITHSPDLGCTADQEWNLFGENYPNGIDLDWNDGNCNSCPLNGVANVVCDASCGNPNGGNQSADNGTGLNEVYCYNANDTTQTRAQKACESHHGEGNCCIITGGYQDQQYGECGQGGNAFHWHWDNHPQGHCDVTKDGQDGQKYVIGDVVNPGWCGTVTGNFLSDAPQPVNECADNNGGCAQGCVDLDKGYECTCEAGYTLGDDGKACNDVDECKGENNCDANATCTNTPGSFGCACNEGYSGNGVECEKDAPQGGTDISQNGKMVFGHHGACEGWNGCGSAEGCANMACQQYGYEKATSWNAITHSPDLGCTADQEWNLFGENYPNGIDLDWNNGNCNSCPLNGVANVVCDAPGYSPVGPQTNVNAGTVTDGGWTQCYSGPYNINANPEWLNACDGTDVMVACREVGAKSIKLLAWAPKADVMFDTGNNSDQLHVANGSGWYYNTDGKTSMGFVAAGDSVQKNNCDTANSGSNDKRLCWHFNAGGYRCGEVDGLNDNAGWERILYTR
jgi:hypothetical protein